MNAPDPQSLRPALRRITETLAHELGSAGTSVHSAATPDWTDTEWLLARAVAAMHGISPLLAGSLKWQGPSGWQSFLEQQHSHTAARHLRIESLQREIHSAARAADLGLIALKGAALHRLGLYQPGERPMADLDLLARPEDAQRTAQLLRGLGFRNGVTSWKHQVFEPAGQCAAGALGESSTNGINIELHFAIKERLPYREAEISPLFSMPAAPGLQGYPSKAALMAHLLLHASGNIIFRALRLIHLHDIALLARRMSLEDWDELLAGDAARARGLWWAFPVLTLAARYYPGIPGQVLGSMASRCRGPLKWLCQKHRISDVSLSNLTVNAFPGIEWSRSLPEMAIYIKHRLIPDARLLEGRKLQAESVPGTAASGWVRMSQGRRILRWVVSRPGRPETMSAVQAALAQVNC